MIQRGRAIWTLALALALAPQAKAQTACTVQTQGYLLGVFSDNAAAGSISPRDIRDFICSSMAVQGGTFLGGISVPALTSTGPTYLPGTSGNNANVTIGAGAANDSGPNISIGQSAGAALTTGQYNTNVGWNNGTAITSGSGNVNVGATSGGAETTGIDNVALGDNVLNAVTSGSNNIAIGDGAGAGIISGSSNIAIGTSVSSSLASISNSVAIGVGVTAAASNTVYLGGAGTQSVIFGGPIGPEAVTNNFPISTMLSFLPDANPPVLSSCGSSGGSLVAGSNNERGTIIEGGTGTGCVVTWAGSGAQPARFCVVSSNNGGVITSYSPGGTALVLVNSSGTGLQFTYVCEQ